MENLVIITYIFIEKMSKVKDRNSDEEIEIEDMDDQIQMEQHSETTNKNLKDSAVTHDKKDRALS